MCDCLCQGAFSSLTILCISPVSIPNPNYGLNPAPGTPLSLKDCTSAYIRVPCGHCGECIASRQMQIVQRVQMQSLSSYVFFATLTYNRESLPFLETSTGYRINFADVHDLQNMLKRIRKGNKFTRPFTYLAVSERGKSKGRPHFHILFFLPKEKDDDPKLTPYNLERRLFDVVLTEWRRNYGSTRKPIYKPLLTYKAIYKRGKLYSPYDLHFVKPVIDDASGSNVAFYVSKYMLKASEKEARLQQALRLNLPADEYESIWSVLRSKMVCSKFFGLNPSPFGDPDEAIYKHLRFGVDKSKLDDFPKFYNVDSGKSFPLAKYYRSKGEIYSLADALPRYFNSDSNNLDSPSEYEDKDYAGLLKVEDDLARRRSLASERGSIDDFANCFD